MFTPFPAQLPPFGSAPFSSFCLLRRLSAYGFYPPLSIRLGGRFFFGQFSASPHPLLFLHEILGPGPSPGDDFAQIRLPLPIPPQISFPLFVVLFPALDSSYLAAFRVFSGAWCSYVGLPYYVTFCCFRIHRYIRLSYGATLFAFAHVRDSLQRCLRRMRQSSSSASAACGSSLHRRSRRSAAASTHPVSALLRVRI